MSFIGVSVGMCGFVWFGGRWSFGFRNLNGGWVEKHWTPDNRSFVYTPNLGDISL